MAKQNRYNGYNLAMRRLVYVHGLSGMFLAAFLSQVYIRRKPDVMKKNSTPTYQPVSISYSLKK
jgi:hypothetical protein